MSSGQVRGLRHKTKICKGYVYKCSVIYVDVWDFVLPLATGIGVFIGQRYLDPYIPERKPRVSDKNIFEIWHDFAFQRHTWEGKFYDETVGAHHVHTEEFLKGISETIYALKTGICKYQGETVEKGKGIRYIKNKQWKNEISDVLNRLNSIENSMKQSRKESKNYDAKLIDEQRDEIIKTLNKIWEANKIPTMELPTNVRIYRYK